MAPSLRERRRAELLEQVKEVAGRHLAAEGAAALSLRAVARDVGIAVSALYRYYASRDDLITELLVDAFTAQADAVDEAARDGQRQADPGAPLRAAFTAYRWWAREHPAEFGLCYGTPVPSYVAPPERTLRAATRVTGTFVRLLENAAAGGHLDDAVVDARERALTAGTAADLHALGERRGYRLSTPVLALAIDAYVRLHGFTAMEVFGHLHPIAPKADSLFQETLEEVMRGLGLANS